VKAKARFDNGSGTLFPNQFVNVRMLVDVLCNAVVVPATAVRHGSQGDYVFTVGADKIAHQVTVTTGPGTGETVSVASGLKGGETVITEGGDRLRDGSTVNLPGQAPQGGSGFQRRPGGRNGQSGQGARAFRGQGGPNGQAFRGRFNRNGQGANVAAPDKETQARAVGEAIPVADGAAACSARGQGGARAANGGPGGARFASGQGFPPGGFRRGQFGPGQGSQGEGQGAPGGGQGVPPGGFRRGQFGQGGQGFPPGGFRGQNGQFQGGGQANGGQPNGGQGIPPGGFRRRGQGQGQAPAQGGDQSQAQGQGG
jgi:hypothetical protein